MMVNSYREKTVLNVQSLLFLLLIVIYGLTTKNTMGGSGVFSGDSILKYGILFLCISLEGYIFFKSGKSGEKISKNYVSFIWYFLILIVLSSVATLAQSNFSFRTIQTFIFIFSPMLYSYLLINNWNFKQIDYAIKFGLFLSFLEYLLSIGTSWSTIFNNLLSINYNNTNSSMSESSTFALLSLGFAAYFGYYKKNYLWKVISLLFVIMTFKRLITLAGIILFIFGTVKLKQIKVNRFLLMFTTVILFSFASFYYYSVQPQNIITISDKLGFSLRDFSTNRTDRLAWLSMTDYKSYGLGSTTNYMYKIWGVDLEMDIVQLFLEVGSIGVVSFFYCYLNFAKGSLYTFVFMTLLLINSTMSSGMTSTFSWIIIFIVMSTIMKYKETKIVL